MGYPWTGNSLEAVAFDMDGTLLNSGIFGVRAIELAFEELIADGVLPGVEAVPGADAIRGQIGKPPIEFYAGLIPDNLAHRARDLHERASHHERSLLRNGSGRMFDGARELLVGLRERGLKLLLVSNCDTGYMDSVVETFALDDVLHFRAAAGRSADVNKTGELKRGLETVGAKTGIMVGDRFHDHDAARANGLWFVGCTYGYGGRNELAGADALIDDIRELTNLLA
ncbi:MAG: HAD hydrolase-like protein [Planctomycetes bacterium]|nr:HAD hydrolase-like protein [Planctomycetota bacterium]